MTSLVIDHAASSTRHHSGVSAAVASLPFSVGLITPLLGLVLAFDPTGPGRFLVPGVVFVAIPILDALLGHSRAPLTPESAAQTARDWRFDLWLWAYVPLQLVAVTVGVGSVVGAFVGGHIDGVAFAVSAVAMGLVTGVGINVAHELMHRRGKVERALAEVLMATTTYTHFCVEHVLGHHKNVSTPNDPASSHLGDSLYSYLPRTLLGGLRSAWHLEGKRRRQAKLPFVSWKNRQFRYPLTLAVIYAAIAVVVGPWGVLFFAAQSLVAMTLLETINFIEHYGLARREIRPGVYERTMPWHSWNASQRLTNCFLFHLQRHADHHHIASRPFYALRHIDESPQLPAGYATMVLLAMVPPLWRRVMDHRVLSWREQAAAIEDRVANNDGGVDGNSVAGNSVAV
jgi:alkane 1-monooxygenase